VERGTRTPEGDVAEKREEFADARRDVSLDSLEKVVAYCS
jgi:hypothetical protein